MSKEIYLYSKDKKYKCAVELADSCDRFNCPDHSALVLFEEREDGTYVIAQAQDNLLETEKDQQIAELEQQLVESEKRLKDIDNWKENYGYSNYEDIYMLEDLQSRAFQSEDDTTVVNELLDYLNISDENEILPIIKQQLANKDKELNDWKDGTIICKLGELEKQIEEKDKEIEELKEKTKTIVSTAYYQLARTTEIIKLKEQLHTQPKEIVEKIKNFMDENTYYYEEEQFAKDIAEYLYKILEEYEEK